MKNLFFVTCVLAAVFCSISVGCFKKQQARLATQTEDGVTTSVHQLDIPVAETYTKDWKGNLTSWSIKPSLGCSGILPANVELSFTDRDEDGYMETVSISTLGPTSSEDNFVVLNDADKDGKPDMIAVTKPSAGFMNYDIDANGSFDLLNQVGKPARILVEDRLVAVDSVQGVGEDAVPGTPPKAKALNSDDVFIFREGVWTPKEPSQ